MNKSYVIFLNGYFIKRDISELVLNNCIVFFLLGEITPVLVFSGNIELELAFPSSCRLYVWVCMRIEGFHALKWQFPSQEVRIFFRAVETGRGGMRGGGKCDCMLCVEGLTCAAAATALRTRREEPPSETERETGLETNVPANDRSLVPRLHSEWYRY